MNPTTTVIARQILERAADIDAAAKMLAKALLAADDSLMALAEADPAAAAIAISRRPSAIIGALHRAGLAGYANLQHQPPGRKVPMVQHDRAALANLLGSPTADMETAS